MHSVESQLLSACFDCFVWHQCSVVGWIVVDVPGVHLLEVSVQSRVPWNHSLVSCLHWLFLNVTNVLDKINLCELVWISEVDLQVEETLDNGTVAVLPESWQELSHVLQVLDGSIGVYLRNCVVVVWHLDFNPFFSKSRSWILAGEDELRVV